MNARVVRCCMVVSLMGLCATGATGAPSDPARDSMPSESATLSPAKSPGEVTYDLKCGMCHAPGRLFPGYMALQEREVAQPDLTKRLDLQPEAIKIIVRRGLGKMPALTPTYISNDEIELVSRWLTKDRKT